MEIVGGPAWASDRRPLCTRSSTNAISVAGHPFPSPSPVNSDPCPYFAACLTVLLSRGGRLGGCATFRRPSRRLRFAAKFAEFLGSRMAGRFTSTGAARFLPAAFVLVDCRPRPALPSCSPMPRFSYPSAICSALRLCLSVCFDVSLKGMEGSRTRQRTTLFAVKSSQTRLF